MDRPVERIAVRRLGGRVVGGVALRRPRAHPQFQCLGGAEVQLLRHRRRDVPSARADILDEDDSRPPSDDDASALAPQVDQDTGRLVICAAAHQTRVHPEQRNGLGFDPNGSQVYLAQQRQAVVDHLGRGGEYDDLIAKFIALTDLPGVDVMELVFRHVEGEVLPGLPLHRLGHLVLGNVRQAYVLDTDVPVRQSADHVPPAEAPAAKQVPRGRNGQAAPLLGILGVRLGATPSTARTNADAPGGLLQLQHLHAVSAEVQGDRPIRLFPQSLKHHKPFLAYEPTIATVTRPVAADTVTR